MAVKGDDNVIYANFGTRKRVSTPAEVNHVDRSGRLLSRTAARISSFTSHEADRGRLSRGRQYAEGGHVVGLEIRNGAIHGRVAGSQNEPFSVLIQLPYRDNDDIAALAGHFARTPNSVANARKGLLSEDALDTLFASEAEELRLSCTCPDSAYTCKHVVAVGDRLATRADADPSVIFNMRGLDFVRLEKAVMDQSQQVSRESFGASDLSAEEKNDVFWNGRELPKLPHPKVAPALEDSDPDLLRKALRAVSHTNIDLLRAVSDIEDLYYHLTH